VTRANTIPFSVYGVPILGLAGLLVCLWHPKTNSEMLTKGPETAYLMPPSPRLDKSMTVFLRQEARNVAYSRRHDTPAVQAKMIAGYNIIAQECTPAVFSATHLPPAMRF